MHAASRAAANDAASAADLAAAAAACVALAAAAAPGVDAYSSALSAVRAALPSPHLRAGWLLVADGGPGAEGGGGGGGDGGSSQPAVGERLAARWCVLDADSLRTAPPPSTAPPPPSHWPTPLAPPDAAPHRLPLASVASATQCDDASLPMGGGVAVTVRSSSTTAFYVAPTPDSAAAWADALTVGAHVVATWGVGALASVLRGGGGGGRRST